MKWLPPVCAGSLLIAGVSFSIGAFAQGDWPQFRGPNGSGTAVGATPPVVWNDSQNMAWKRALPGPGSSSPIISGERIFITFWSGYGAKEGAGAGQLLRHLVCLEAKEGRIVWDKTITGE